MKRQYPILRIMILPDVIKTDDLISAVKEVVTRLKIRGRVEQTEQYLTLWVEDDGDSSPLERKPDDGGNKKKKT